MDQRFPRPDITLLYHCFWRPAIIDLRLGMERMLMPCPDSETVFDQLKENSDKLREFGVERIGLFGSFLKGEQDPESDIDFLVELEENSFDNYMGLKLFLEELFDREIDLVIESDIREELGHVKEDAVYVTPA